MDARRGLALILAGAAVAGGWSTAAVAVSPLDRLFTFKRVEADPQKSYRLTAQNGPWMIMACTFSGERADEQARTLALELRKRYKLEAYTYKKEFDLSGDKALARPGQFGGPVEAHYRRGTQFEEVAVLVGNYASVDDPEGQRTLRKLKYYQPECLKLRPGRPTNQNLASWRLFWSLVSAEQQEKGPMRSAIMTTNPVLPSVPQGLDPLVLKANEGVEHSLLDCPGKYSLRVATFTGQVLIKQDQVARLQDRKFDASESRLVEAAEKAHELTEGLRLKGYEAYEFHDRYASMVTVGSFDWVRRRLPDGRIQNNPAIEARIERFGAKKTDRTIPSTGGWPGESFLVSRCVPETFLGIPLDPKPQVVQVPRRPISARLNRNVTTLF